MKPALRVVRSLFTTIQDLGRPAMQRYGVPVSGAMDRMALEAANRLVANPPAAAALEVTAGSTAFEVLTPLLLAIGGADLGAQLDGMPLPPWVAAFARPGAELLFTGRRGPWGARAYLAPAGGVAAPEVLGSCSTYVPGSFGGMEGRPLRAGDVVMVHEARIDPVRCAGRTWPTDARPPYQAVPRLRVLPGPHAPAFATGALATLCSQPFRVSSDASRMGYRLEGPPLQYAGNSVPSLGVFPGVVQVPPDGVPILLMADAQTVGGYPIIAVVIEPDLPLAAQLLPGDSLRFTVTTIAAARAARQQIAVWRATALEQDAAVAALAWTGAW